MSAPTWLAEIKERHTDFEQRYSPGPDWEPCNQLHRDRAILLSFVEKIAKALQSIENALPHDPYDAEGTAARTLTVYERGPKL